MTVEADGIRIDLTYPDARAAVVGVTGEIDLSVHEELTKVITEAVGTPGIGKVVVDLAGTTFMDSTGIRVLLAGREKAQVAKVGYQVIGTTGLVREVLKVTGVLAVLENADIEV